MINDNIKVTNDRLDKISQDVTDLKQSLLNSRKNK